MGFPILMAATRRRCSEAIATREFFATVRVEVSVTETFRTNEFQSQLASSLRNIIVSCT